MQDVPESLAHVLSGCSSLARNRYFQRHNAALKILLFEKLRDFALADSVPPWYSRVQPKSLYESSEAKAYWDLPAFAKHEYLLQNRLNARFVNYKEKKVTAVEMSCPWVENRMEKAKRKLRNAAAP